MTMRSRRGLLALAAGAAMATAPAALAGGPCADDAKSFCGGVDPGQGRMQSCLRSHWGDLAPACQKYLDRVSSATQLFYYQCEPEIFELCQDVPVGKGDVLACLKSHGKELSATCRSAVDGAKVPD